MRKELSHIEVKNELLFMLRELNDYFEKMGIQYSIMSGTMLGAIRHKGFIPWDDDIDVGMQRSEYQKLYEIVKSAPYINEFLKFEGSILADSDFPFLKLVNTKIDAEETLLEDKVASTKLWIDIFPFDEYPENFNKQFLNKLHCVYQRIYDIKRFKEFGLKYHCKRILIPYHLFLKFIYRKMSVMDVANIIDEYCQKYNGTQSRMIMDMTWGNKPVPADLFNELVDYNFENIVVKGFKDYDTYLTYVYKDYMKLPPEDQRVNHGLKAWRVEQ